MALLLKGGLLIDGTGADPRPRSAVLVEGDRIARVGDVDEVTAPPGTTLVDISGKTLMPGLINCHEHLAYTGNDFVALAAMPLSLRHLMIAGVLRSVLESGFTTVRDPGGLDVGFKMAVEQGLVPGPRLLVSLCILCRTGGLADRWLLSGIEVALTPPGPPRSVFDGVDEARKRVREVLRAGADVVKCASTGGVSSRVLSPTDPGLTLEELRTLVEEARMMGKRTMCHAHGGLGLQNALDAGIDSIEHGSYLCRKRDQAKQMAAQGTFLVPTFAITRVHRERGAPWAKRKAIEACEMAVQSLHLAMAEGVRVALGTDLGYYGQDHCAVELQHWVEAGMTAMQAIVAATRSGAECLGLEADLGTLEAGKYADLLVVDGNPIENIRVLDQRERLLLVMKAGVAYVDRLHLSA